MSVSAATFAPSDPEAEFADVIALLGGLLERRAAPFLLDEASRRLGERREGILIVASGLSDATRLRGRDLGLPRRVVVALDNLASTLRPSVSTVITWSDKGAAPWALCLSDLSETGFDAPLLIELREGTAPLGLLAAFFSPELTTALKQNSPSPTEAVRILGLEPWVTAMSLILARESDRSRLERATVEDEVTGLPNRTLTVAKLQHALDEGSQTLALIEVSLERLDELEDAVGVARGVDLLRATARRVSEAIRPSDMLGHLRPNALGVVCEDIEAEGAVDVAERVRMALSEPIKVGDHELQPIAGVGVVEAMEGDTVQSLIHKADMAARESASRGGATAVRYRPGSYEAALARIDVDNDLRRALSDGELYLAYQPQVRLSDHQLIGVEALVRWDHPTRGVVSPEQFIPIAEESGFVVDLGAWAVDTAISDISLGLDVVVSVNLSPRQLDDPTLLARITSSLMRHGVDAERLRLEITESSLTRDPEAGSALLSRLRSAGIRVSIDDFGTGYASLEQLRQTAVADSLKIDRTFVAGIETDHRDRAIVAAAVALGRALGFTVVAEGVENPAQAEILSEMGCHAAQGFLFGEAVRWPSAELVKSKIEGF